MPRQTHTRRGFLGRSAAAVSLSLGVGGFADSPSGTTRSDRSPEGFTDEVVADGLDRPTSVVTLPDGRLLIGEKAGRVHVVRSGDRSPYLRIPNVETNGEAGLTTLRPGPSFGTDGYLYCYYARRSEEPGRKRWVPETEDFSPYPGAGWWSTGTNVVVRLTDEGESATVDGVVWADPQPRNEKFGRHYGGGMDFGPDGDLYLCTGDRFQPWQAQIPSASGGKILRIDPSLADPGERGSGGSTAKGGQGATRWAMGLRNPFRARWDPETDRFLIGDVGGSLHRVDTEAIDLGVAGANYGWPVCGRTVEPAVCDRERFRDPLFAYPHEGRGASVTGGLVYRGDQFPEQYRGAYVYGDFVRRWIRYLTFEADGSVAESSEFATGVGGVVDFDVGPDGSLYYVDFFGSVHRVDYGTGG